jgi:hypothetical protein
MSSRSSKYFLAATTLGKPRKSGLGKTEPLSLSKREGLIIHPTKEAVRSSLAIGRLGESFFSMRLLTELLRSKLTYLAGIRSLGGA